MKASTHLLGLQAEIRNNPRLQVGGLVIALVLIGWLLLLLSDWRESKLTQLAGVQERLTQVRALAGQSIWAERADEAERLAQSLAAEVPDIASPGLAQADFQGWLREVSSGYGTNLRLEVQEPVRLEDPTGLVRVSATISGRLAPDRAVQLIGRIESRTSLATIPVLTVRNDGTNPSVSLTVQGFYRLSPRSAP